MKYFLGRDYSYHWYVIPLENREEWNNWVMRPIGKPPSFAKRLNHRLSFLVFENPQIPE